jgi:hypothetical protein
MYRETLSSQSLSTVIMDMFCCFRRRTSSSFSKRDNDLLITCPGPKSSEAYSKANKIFHGTELKDTHLAPLGNTFGRSSSTSTITPEQEKEKIDGKSEPKVSESSVESSATTPSSEGK